jgi:membrane-associated protein
MISTVLLFELSDLLNPEQVIKVGGLTLLLFIIFAETGLFFGFFLPGDSLLFIAGLFVAQDDLKINVWLMILLLIIAAIAGTTVGYFFGKFAENYLRNKKENFFYKKKYLEMAQDFYGRHGMMAFILGRFMPIVRTFVPILAGMVRIEFGKFLFFNIVGAAIWIIVMVMAGNVLGKKVPAVAEHLEIIVVGMVLVSAVPVILQWFKHRGQAAKKKPENFESNL